MLIIPISGNGNNGSINIDYHPVLIACLWPVTCGPLTNQKCGNHVKMCEHMEKADFLYFEVEAPNEIHLIMFRDSSLTFPAKNQKKLKVHFWVINL